MRSTYVAIFRYDDLLGEVGLTHFVFVADCLVAISAVTCFGRGTTGQRSRIAGRHSVIVSDEQCKRRSGANL